MENKVSRNFLSSKSIAFKIAFCAIFVALLTVTNFFSYQISEIFELSFVMAVSFFAGLILDVPLSFMVGFLADMLGHFISPKGPYNIFINISSGLFCAIPALLYFIVNKVLNKNNNFLSFIFILSTSFILYYVFCSVFLNSIGLWILSNSWAQ